jgi:predicted transposase YbfD/YdcC
MDFTVAIFDDAPRARLALLLEHFSELSDDREPECIMYALTEVLLLVTCATIASCDDFDDIVALGEQHLGFLRRFSEFHFGTSCERWLRSVVNRVDPLLFGRCFESWVAALWPGRHDLIAVDGKTARRSHDRSVPEKTNEITAIPELLDQLAAAKQLEAALVAMGCQVEIADTIVAHKAGYLLALKGNQPTLEADVEDYFSAAPAAELITKTTVEKGHGRIETRSYSASSNVDWIVSERSYRGQPRFKTIKTLVWVQSRAEYADRYSFDTRYFISSAPSNIDRLAAAVRGHWGVESMHWLLDVEFKDDLSRYRTGHGAENMAVVRRFALGLVCANKSKRSVKVKTATKKLPWNFARIDA